MKSLVIFCTLVAVRTASGQMAHDEPLTVENPVLRVDFNPCNNPRPHPMFVIRDHNNLARVLERKITGVKTVTIKYRNASNEVPLAVQLNTPIHLDDTNNGRLHLSETTESSAKYFTIVTTGQMGQCPNPAGVSNCQTPNPSFLQSVSYMPEGGTGMENLCFDNGMPVDASNPCKTATPPAARAWITFHMTPEPSHHPCNPHSTVQKK